MNERIKKIINEKDKPSWLERNYYFLGTLVIVALNVLLFLIGGNNWTPRLKNGSWNDVLNFHNLVVYFLKNFEHANLQHCLLNSLCFLIVGIYLERQQGTLPFFVLTILFSFLGTCGVATNYSGGFHGFSGTNYCLYAYVFIDFFFILFHKEQKTPSSLIYGCIMLVLIYIATCFCGGTSSFSFKPYPYDLISNMGHYVSFFLGCILTFAIKFFNRLAEKK